MLMFTSEPEGSINTLSPGSTETVWIWFDFSMSFLPESASDEAVGHRAIIHSQGPCHVEMVGSACPTGGRSSAAFFQRIFSVVSIMTSWSWMIMDTQGSIPATIQTWDWLRVRTGMLFSVCSDLSSAYVF